MCKRLLPAIACAFALASSAAAGATSREHPVGIERSGGDVYMAGGSLTVDREVAGDLIATGGSIDVDEPVGGDLVGFGGKLRIGAAVGRSVYAAAGQITVNAEVGRNLRLAGGRLEFGPRSHVAGSLTAAGGRIVLRGMVDGYLKLAAERVLIDGPVGGDVAIAARRIELGPNARITGRLRYRSAEPLLQDPAAQVGGPIERFEPPPGREQTPQAARAAESRHLIGATGVAWTIGLAVIAAVLLAALPGFTATVGRTLRARPGVSMLLGFVLLVCTPVAVVILMVTLVGIPLALLGLLLYVALLPLGYIVAAIALADGAIGRWQPQHGARTGLRLAATVAALLLLMLLGWIPVVGTLTGMLAMLAGVGALLLQFGRGGQRQLAITR